MALLDVETPQYGDKIKMQNQLAGSPLPANRPQKVGAVLGTSSPEQPPTVADVPPHTQRHLWVSNYLLKKANEVRPGLPGMDEVQASKLFAAKMAIELAEATGDPDMHALAQEIMDDEDDPYSFFGSVAAAKMDDVEIAEGRWQGGIPEQSMEQGAGLVQGDSDNGGPEPKAEKPEPRPAG